MFNLETSVVTTPFQAILWNLSVPSKQSHYHQVLKEMEIFPQTIDNDIVSYIRKPPNPRILYLPELNGSKLPASCFLNEIYRDRESKPQQIPQKDALRWAVASSIFWGSCASTYLEVCRDAPFIINLCKKYLDVSNQQYVYVCDLSVDYEDTLREANEVPPLPLNDVDHTEEKFHNLWGMLLQSIPCASASHPYNQSYETQRHCASWASLMNKLKEKDISTLRFVVSPILTNEKVDREQVYPLVVEDRLPWLIGVWMIFKKLEEGNMDFSKTEYDDRLCYHYSFKNSFY